MSAIDVQNLQNQISARETTAEQRGASADAAVSSNLSAANTAAGGVRIDTVYPGGIVGATPTNVPTPAGPASDFSNDVRTAFDYAFGMFQNTVMPQIQNFLGAYFPTILQAVKDNSDAWIANTILNGNAMPAAVEATMWAKAKDNELLANARVSQEIVDAFAMRGFTAPPGAMLNAVTIANQESARRLATLNRELTIERYKMANENMKFAVQQAISLRSAMVAAMGDFIKVVTNHQNLASDYAKTVLAAKTSFYDSVLKLYAAQIDEERGRATTIIQNDSNIVSSNALQVSANSNRNQYSVERAKLQTEAAMKAAEILSQTAAAAYAASVNIQAINV
jgi:hypothetical protein